MMYRLGVVSLAAVVVLAAGAHVSHAQVPELMNYQGRLVSGTNLVNTRTTMVFRLHDESLSVVYVETQQLSIVDGLYSAHIGASNPVPGSLRAAGTNEELYISVQVGDGPSLLPAERVTAVQYALWAGGVTGGAIQSSMLASGAVTAAKIESGAIRSNHLAADSVGSAQLADDAVQGAHVSDNAIASNNIQPGAVSTRELTKSYRSGFIEYADTVQTGTIDFAAYTADEVVPLSPPFSTPPALTLGLQTDATNVNWTAPRLLDAGPAGFLARLSIPSNVNFRIDRVGNLSAGTAVSIARVANRPAVAYDDRDLGVLYYCRAEDPYGIEWGTPLPVATTNSSGNACDLAVINGYPAIAFQESSSQDLYYVRASNAVGSAWAPPIRVHTNGRAGNITGLLEVNGRPAIAFQEGTSDDLFFIRALDSVGTVWPSPTLVATNIGTYPISMKIISTLPAIAYQDGAGDYLRYRRADDVNGSAWTTAPSVLDTNENTGQYASLAVVNNRPAIAYRRYESGPGAVIYYIRAEDSTGSAWPADPIAVYTNNAGSYASLSVAAGVPVIAAQDEEYDRLLFIAAHDADGDYWGDGRRLTPDIGHSANVTAIDMTTIGGAPAVTYAQSPGTNDTIHFIRSGNPPADARAHWIAVEP